MSSPSRVAQLENGSSSNILRRHVSWVPSAGLSYIELAKAPVPQRVYLVNTYHDRERVKSLGAVYNANGGWYVHQSADKNAFKKWWPNDRTEMVAASQPEFNSLNSLDATITTTATTVAAVATSAAATVDADDPIATATITAITTTTSISTTTVVAAAVDAGDPIDTVSTTTSTTTPPIITTTSAANDTNTAAASERTATPSSPKAANTGSTSSSTNAPTTATTVAAVATTVAATVTTTTSTTTTSAITTTTATANDTNTATAPEIAATSTSLIASSVLTSKPVSSVSESTSSSTNDFAAGQVPAPAIQSSVTATSGATLVPVAAADDVAVAAASVHSAFSIDVGHTAADAAENETKRIERAAQHSMENGNDDEDSNVASPNTNARTLNNSQKDNDDDFSDSLTSFLTHNRTDGNDDEDSNVASRSPNTNARTLINSQLDNDDDFSDSLTSSVNKRKRPSFSSRDNDDNDNDDDDSDGMLSKKARRCSRGTLQSRFNRVSAADSHPSSNPSKSDVSEFTSNTPSSGGRSSGCLRHRRGRDTFKRISDRYSHCKSMVDRISPLLSKSPAYPQGYILSHSPKGAFTSLSYFITPNGSRCTSLMQALSYAFAYPHQPDTEYIKQRIIKTLASAGIPGLSSLPDEEKWNTISSSNADNHTVICSFSAAMSCTVSLYTMTQQFTKEPTVALSTMFLCDRSPDVGRKCKVTTGCSCRIFVLLVPGAPVTAFVPLLRVSQMNEMSFTFTHPNAAVRYIPTVLSPISFPGPTPQFLASGYLCFTKDTDGHNYSLGMFKSGDTVAVRAEAEANEQQVRRIVYIRMTSASVFVGICGIGDDSTVMEVCADMVSTCARQLVGDVGLAFTYPNEFVRVSAGYTVGLHSAWIQNAIPTRCDESSNRDDAQEHTDADEDANSAANGDVDNADKSVPDSDNAGETDHENAALSSTSEKVESVSSEQAAHANLPSSEPPCRVRRKRKSLEKSKPSDSEISTSKETCEGEHSTNANIRASSASKRCLNAGLNASLDPDLVYFLGSSTSEDLARKKLKQENKPLSDKDISAAKVDVWTAMNAKSRTALLKRIQNGSAQQDSVKEENDPNVSMAFANFMVNARTTDRARAQITSVQKKKKKKDPSSSEIATAKQAIWAALSHSEKLKWVNGDPEGSTECTLSNAYEHFLACPINSRRIARTLPKTGRNSALLQKKRSAWMALGNKEKASWKSGSPLEDSDQENEIHVADAREETAKMNYMVNESLNASIEKTIIDARSRHSKKRGQFDHTVTLEQVATHKLENWRRMPREQRLTWEKGVPAGDTWTRSVAESKKEASAAAAPTRKNDDDAEQDQLSRFMASDLAFDFCKQLCARANQDCTELVIRAKMKQYWSGMKRTIRCTSAWEQLIQRSHARLSPLAVDGSKVQSTRSQTAHCSRTSSISANERNRAETTGRSDFSTSSATSTSGATNPTTAEAQTLKKMATETYPCCTAECEDVAVQFCYQCRKLLCPHCLTHHLHLFKTHSSMQVCYFQTVCSSAVTTSKQTIQCSERSSITRPSANVDASSSSSDARARVSDVATLPESFPCVTANCEATGTEACIECSGIQCIECFRHHDRFHASHHRASAVTFRLMQQQQIKSNCSSAARPMTTHSSTSTAITSFAPSPPFANHVARMLPLPACQSPSHPFKRMPTVISPPDIKHHITSSAGYGHVATRTPMCEFCSVKSPTRGCGHCGTALCHSCAHQHSRDNPSHALCDYHVMWALRSKLGHRRFLVRSSESVPPMACLGCSLKASYVCVRCFTVYCAECSQNHASAYGSSSPHDQWKLAEISDDVAVVLRGIAQSRHDSRAQRHVSTQIARSYPSPSSSESDHMEMYKPTRSHKKDLSEHDSRPGHF